MDLRVCWTLYCKNNTLVNHSQPLEISREELYLTHMQHTVESHKLFPYIAWATVLSFAFFTYTLAANLQSDLSEINESVERVESSLAEMQAERAAADRDAKADIAE